jgi:hypothetical protein
MQNTLLESETNDAYLRWLFVERQCVRLVCLTEEVAVIRIGTTPLATDGENVDVELSTLNERSREWLRSMPQSTDETERSFESARVTAERERMRNAFEQARSAAEQYRSQLAEIERDTSSSTAIA